MCIKSAPPIVPPGCPEFAFSAIEMASALILSADNWSFFLCYNYKLGVFG